MFVTCSACSTKFQLPDDKIAGRKARMKCKTCGAPIDIDGTSAAPSGAKGPPPAPSRRPGGAARPEAPTWNDQTVALGAAQAEALSLASRPNASEAALDLEDRVTPVSNPRAAGVLDQGYVDEAMDALEQKVFSVPAPKAATADAPAAAAPAGQTKGLPTAQATGPSKAAPAQPVPPQPAPAKPAPARPAPGKSASGKLPPRPAPPPAAAPPTRTAPGTADDEEATRMMDLPRVLSGAPAPGLPGAQGASSPALPDSETEEPTRMIDAPSSNLAAEEATRIFDPDPVPRAPGLPPRPSLPRPAASASSPSTDEASTLAPPSEPAVVLNDPTPLDARAEPADVLAPGASFPAPPSAASGIRRPRGPVDLTVQRSRVSPVPVAPRPSNWGLYLFVVAVAATTTLVLVYVLARPTFDQAIAATRASLGLGPAERGAAFDPQVAAEELARVAAKAPACKQPGGPTGPGRARVMFQGSGIPSSAAFSPPFHASTSEACLLGLFLGARVPPFDGPSVIVTKTFRVD